MQYFAMYYMSFVIVSSQACNQESVHHNQFIFKLHILPYIPIFAG